VFSIHNLELFFII